MFCNCKNHYPGKTNSSQLPKRLSMKKRNLSTKKNVKSICPVCPSSRSFHPALEAYLRSFGRKEPLDLALPHPSPDSNQHVYCITLMRRLEISRNNLNYFINRSSVLSRDFWHSVSGHARPDISESVVITDLRSPTRTRLVFVFFFSLYQS